MYNTTHFLIITHGYQVYKKKITRFKSGYPIRCYKLYTSSSEHRNEDSGLKYGNKTTEPITYTIKANNEDVDGGHVPDSQKDLHAATERLAGRQITSSSQTAFAPLFF